MRPSKHPQSSMRTTHDARTRPRHWPTPAQDTKPPKPREEKREKRQNTHRSVAICSFAIALRSSWLVAADVFVSGVPAVLPLTDPEPVGVDVPVVVDASPPAAAPLAFADCFAAFSARRFCFEAEGAIVCVCVYVSVCMREWAVYV